MPVWLVIYILAVKVLVVGPIADPKACFQQAGYVDTIIKKSFESPDPSVEAWAQGRKLKKGDVVVTCISSQGRP